MPNGGSDCCGTCCFNEKNRGQVGDKHAREPGRHVCLIRSFEIDGDPYYTYCANHPHHNLKRLRVPIGPVYKGDSSGRHAIQGETPDSETLRQRLLGLLAEVPDAPPEEYPAGPMFSESVALALGDLRERRAAAGLQRILTLEPSRENSFGCSNARLIAIARRVLERIEAESGEPPPPWGFRLHLVDVSAALVHEWRRAFADHPEVWIAQAGILGHAWGSAVVSPANSYGFMDGGIDLVYVNHFGPQLQRQVQDAIARRPGGLLPVGGSLVVRTGDECNPHLIVAPTMETPERVPPQHAYRAMRAALRAAWEHRDVVFDLCCPGLCTGVGGVPPDMAAREMAAAYCDWRDSIEDPALRIHPPTRADR